MKNFIKTISVLLLLFIFGLLAVGSSDSSETNTDEYFEEFEELTEADGGEDIEETEAMELSDNEAVIPYIAYYFEGEQYTDVVLELNQSGFKNIITREEEINSLTWLIDEGEISRITVNGSDDYSEGQIFDKNTEIVVTYYTYSKEAKDNQEKNDAITNDENTTDTLTADNCEELKSLLNSYWSDDTENRWMDFATKYKGRTIEIDAVMMYSETYEEGSTLYAIGIYSDYNGNKQYNPVFFYDTRVLTTRGLENFDFKNWDSLDEKKVHAKIQIEYYDKDLQRCNVKLINVEPRD